uniref:Uncharacterized protein n=1 Tax=Solanum tuberosum TaxID=4113 RepID=M1DPH5_SOLTU
MKNILRQGSTDEFTDGGRSTVSAAILGPELCEKYSKTGVYGRVHGHWKIPQSFKSSLDLNPVKTILIQESTDWFTDGEMINSPWKAFLIGPQSTYSLSFAQNPKNSPIFFSKFSLKASRDSRDLQAPSLFVQF